MERTDWYCIGLIVAIALYMQWSRGSPIVFTETHPTKEKFVNISSDDWEHDIMQLRGMLTPVVSDTFAYLRAKNAAYFMTKGDQYYPSSTDPILMDPDLLGTRNQVVSLIESFDKWVKTKYGNSAVAEYQKRDMVSYMVNANGTLTLVDRVGGKEFYVSV